MCDPCRHDNAHPGCQYVGIAADNDLCLSVKHLDQCIKGAVCSLSFCPSSKANREVAGFLLDNFFTNDPAFGILDLFFKPEGLTGLEQCGFHITFFCVNNYCW
jgi:hypothetical protein